MKRAVLMMGFLMLMLGTSMGASAKDRSRLKKEQAAVVKMLLARDAFRVDLNQVQPTGLDFARLLFRGGGSWPGDAPSALCGQWI